MKVLASPSFSNQAANPYNSLLYSEMIEHGIQVQEFSYGQALKNQGFIWHIHWPELALSEPNFLKAILKLQILIASIGLVKLQKGKIIWTGHNLKSHERLYPRIESWFWNFFTGCLDGFISLSEAGLKAAQEKFPKLKKVPSYVVPHGHYRTAYPNTLTYQEARAALEIPNDATVLLFFGRIRAYKNIPKLIDIFQQLSAENILLYIVGQSEADELTQQILRATQSHQHIRSHLKLASPTETQLFFQASDLVILPYREILNSGTALLALSFNRPVLLPQGAVLSELQASVGADWVHLYEGELTVEIVQQAIDWVTNAPRSERTNLDRFEWSVLAQQTIEAYQEILSC